MLWVCHWLLLDSSVYLCPGIALLLAISSHELRAGRRERGERGTGAEMLVRAEIVIQPPPLNAAPPRTSEYGSGALTCGHFTKALPQSYSPVSPFSSRNPKYARVHGTGTWQSATAHCLTVARGVNYTLTSLFAASPQQPGEFKVLVEQLGNQLAGVCRIRVE